MNKQFSDNEILTILKQRESGMKIRDVCEQHGISSSTFYQWQAKYAGMDESLLNRLKMLEIENQTLRQDYQEVNASNDKLKFLLEKVIQSF